MKRRITYVTPTNEEVAVELKRWVSPEGRRGWRGVVRGHLVDFERAEHGIRGWYAFLVGRPRIYPLAGNTRTLDACVCAAIDALDELRARQKAG